MIRRFCDKLGLARTINEQIPLVPQASVGFGERLVALGSWLWSPVPPSLAGPVCLTWATWVRTTNEPFPPSSPVVGRVVCSGLMVERSGKWGLTLGTTLLVVLLVVIMAFTLTASSVHHLHANARLSNGAHARQLADSAIALGLETILVDESFGKDGEATVEIVSPDWAPAGSRAILTFDKEGAEREGIPYSTNNLGSDTDSIPGWNSRTVPASGANLVAEAECRGARRRVEAVLRVPPFPYVIATSGTIRSSGGLLVAATDSVDALTPGVSRIDHEDLLPRETFRSGAGGKTVTTSRAWSIRRVG